MQRQSPSLLRDRFFGGSLAATIIAFIACLSTHIITILGVAGAIAWLGELEHALLFTTVAFSGLTLYAWRRHRRAACDCVPTVDK